MNDSNPNVVDLTDRITIDVRVRSLLGMLRLGPALFERLLLVMRSLGHDDQLVLSQLVAWRLGGGFLPCSESLVHFPLLTKLGMDRIKASIERMYDADVLAMIEPEDGTAHQLLVWPALERMIQALAEEAKRPKFVGADGAQI